MSSLSAPISTLQTQSTKLRQRIPSFTILIFYFAPLLVLFISYYCLLVFFIDIVDIVIAILCGTFRILLLPLLIWWRNELEIIRYASLLTFDFFDFIAFIYFFRFTFTLPSPPHPSTSKRGKIRERSKARGERSERGVRCRMMDGTLIFNNRDATPLCVSDLCQHVTIDMSTQTYKHI